jgi:hypothetical protein
MEASAPVRFGGGSGPQANATIGELYPYDSLHELAS